MATAVYRDKTVTIIQPQEDGTLINVGALEGNPTGNDSICLPNNHPAYSAIFALLMASAANKKPIHEICVDTDARPFLTIKHVSYFF